MTSLIPICIGKAGIDSSALLWQLVGKQHDINKDGTLQNYQKWDKQNNKLQGFYNQSSPNKFTLNAICLDTEQDVIDSLKLSGMKQLFHHDNLISGKNNSKGLFANGWLNDGKEIVEIAIDPIRKMVQSFDKFGGFMLINSMAGGTGSGLSSCLLKTLSEQFHKYQKLCVNVYPDNDQLTAKTAYNTMFAVHNQLQYADITVVMDNETIKTLCQTQLNIKDYKYSDLNQIIAHCMSGLTLAMRRNQSILNVDIKQLIVNTIPYPRFKFMLNNYAPLYQTSPHNPMPREITIDAFNKKNSLADCCYEEGKFMACSILYRGDIIPKDVGPGIMAIKTNASMQFVDWCPTGFKCGISYALPSYFQNSIVPKVTRTAYTVCNSTSVKIIFKRVCDNFNEFYSEKSMVNEYLQEGLQEGDFQEALENVVILCADYDEVEIDTGQDPAHPASEEG